MKPMKSIVLIPTYNERENIISLLREVSKVAPDVHMLVIDDNSPDGTAVCVEEYTKECPNLHIIRRERKLGLGSAYVAGFGYCLNYDFDYILTMDADFSHTPQTIPHLIEAMKECDLALGSRFVKGAHTPGLPMHRRLFSRIAGSFIESKFHLKIKDYTTGFRCYKCEALRRLNLKDIFSLGYGFQIEMVYRMSSAGGKIMEYPITFMPRKKGKTKVSFSDIKEAYLTTVRLAKK